MEIYSVTRNRKDVKRGEYYSSVVVSENRELAEEFVRASHRDFGKGKLNVFPVESTETRIVLSAKL